MKMKIENGQSAGKHFDNFKPVVGFEDYYLISKDGEVYSIRTGKILRVKTSHNGYLGVQFNIKGKPTDFRINRLVAMTYLPNPKNLPEVNHKDFNPLNNNVNNLEWCTHFENIHHSIDAGRFDVNKEVHKLYRFTHRITGETFELLGMASVAAYFEVKTRTISVINKYGNTGKHVGGGILKDFIIEIIEVKPQRLSLLREYTQVGGSEKHPAKDEDIV
jgi:hypothetical protein